MKILINASNIGKGGASQVTDSICLQLKNVIDKSFVVVLPESLAYLKNELNLFSHIEVIIHNVSHSKWTKLSGRERFLDTLVQERNIDCVLSIFGPTWWIPRRPHLAGFALAHLVMPESPYFKRMGFWERLKSKVHCLFMEIFFRRCSKVYYTENAMITERLQKKFPSHKVYTVTNYYNQVFDQPKRWQPISLPDFDGCTMLTLATPNPHKNLEIAIPIAKYLKEKHPDFKFRFVFSFHEEQYPTLPTDLKEHFLFIGYVSIYQCPSLYQQTTIVFQPTLLECFTAAYPEAMVMQRPIITTSLAFARGLCGAAALYYSPTSAEEAADQIYTLANDQSLQLSLVDAGNLQIKTFDSYNDRVNKLLDICNQISSHPKNNSRYN